MKHPPYREAEMEAEGFVSASELARSQSAEAMDAATKTAGHDGRPAQTATWIGSPPSPSLEDAEADFWQARAEAIEHARIAEQKIPRARVTLTTGQPDPPLRRIPGRGDGA